MALSCCLKPFWVNLLDDHAPKGSDLRLSFRHNRNKPATNCGAMRHSLKAHLQAQALILAQEFVEFTVTKSASHDRDDRKHQERESRENAFPATLWWSRHRLNVVFFDAME
jgi:hypothetical protein